MNLRALYTAVLTVAVTLVCTPLGSVEAESLRQTIQATQVIDLTHTMHENMPFWPGGVPFKKIRLVDYDQGYQLHKFDMGENTGTHVDAPSHFIKGKRPIDKIPLADLIVPAVVIDVQGNCSGYVVKTEIMPPFATSVRWPEAEKERVHHATRPHVRR